MGTNVVNRPRVPEGLLIVAPEFIPGYAVPTGQLPSPRGTTEIPSLLVGVQPSLRDSGRLVGAAYPAMNRRAAIQCSSGTSRQNGLS